MLLKCNPFGKFHSSLVLDVEVQISMCEYLICLKNINSSSTIKLMEKRDQSNYNSKLTINNNG